MLLTWTGTGPAQAALLNVPSTNYSTIQAALDAAQNGDTVLVADGIYAGTNNRDLDFKGKQITVQSEHGPAACIIDCDGGGRGFYFHTSEGTSSVLSGFTITDAVNGGIYCYLASPKITNCILTENSGGGLFFYYAAPKVTNCVISSNTGDSDAAGGGVLFNRCNFQPYPEISNCTILNNTGTDGGGIFCLDSSPLISNCSIQGNSAVNGGGIYCQDAAPTISNCIINANDASTSSSRTTREVDEIAYGGGIYLGASTPKITGCTISANTAGDGAGIYATFESAADISGCTVSANEADESVAGGGLTLLFDSDADIDDCAITGNTGAGIYCGYASPNITGSTISDNSVSGIYLDYASPTIEACFISDNTGTNGAGIYCKYFASPDIVNCIITGNTSTATPSGGAIGCWYSSAPTITNCTISANTGITAGGLYCNSADPTLTNCILWDDSSPEIYITESSPNITYCDLEGSFSGTGNIAADPLFSDAASEDYQLSDGSPAIDTGTSTDAPDEDIAGTERPQGQGIDMGAYEATPNETNTLYFPQVISTTGWKTEVAVINPYATQSLSGTLRAYDAAGEEVAASKSIDLGPYARREITVGTDFSNADQIAYLVLTTGDKTASGYYRIYNAGQTQSVMLPAMATVNSGSVYMPFLASDTTVISSLALLNTSSSTKTLAFQFDDGSSKSLTIAAGAQKALTLRSLFDETAQSGINAGKITNATGILGAAFVFNANVLDAMALTHDSATTLYVPSIPATQSWATVLIAYNPSSSADATLTLTPYDTAGTAGTAVQVTVSASKNTVQPISGLGLPSDTAWLHISASSAVNACQAFMGTGGNTLGFTSLHHNTGSNGFFPRLAVSGTTTITIANTEAETALVTFTAYDDEGEVVAATTKVVQAHAVLTRTTANLFEDDITGATHIRYAADRVIATCLRIQDSDGQFLETLPGIP